ncbi:hypothetical protein A2U01_0113455, partial [Trifolium medium]|nr:hypothetical protein [Trifolium medium]
RVAQHYPARSAGTRNQNALNIAALRAAQLTEENQKTEKHGALCHTAVHVAPEPEHAEKCSFNANA